MQRSRHSHSFAIRFPKPKARPRMQTSVGTGRSLKLRQQSANRGPSRQSAVRCSAFFSLFKKPEATVNDGRIVEKPVYQAKEMVELGSSGIKVSPMGLGTWSWGNQFLWNYSEDMDPELQEVYNLVVASGINFFDTADSYGTGRLDGKSEKLLGKFSSEYPGSERVRNNLHVATKFAAYPWRVTPGSIVSAARASAQRLGVDAISLGQLHWSASNYAPLQELGLRAGLAECYEQGVVRAVGVSNYGPRQLREIHKYLDKRGVPLATAQIQFSLLSRGKEQLAVKELCDELGITLISYSPLALGLLSGKYSKDNLPSGPRGGLFKTLLPEVQPLLDVLEAIAQERRKSTSQVAINWCIAKGTVPIPGAKDLQQARENLGALGWRLSSGEVAELDAVANRLKKGMVQNIFQTS